MLIMRNSIRLQVALVLSLLSSLATAQTATNVVCTSCVGSTDIATDAVTASDIAANAVAAAEIATNAVAAAEIAPDAVTASEIATNAVTALEIAPDAVTASEIATNAVTAAEIATNAVTALEIATSAVTTAEIADGTVALVDLSPALEASLAAPLVAITSAEVSSSGESVAGVSCPSDTFTFVVSASCGCDHEDGVRNFGVLAACALQGNGAVALCYVDHTFDPNLPPPLARIGAICLGGTSADGSPWLPGPIGLANNTKSAGSLSTTSATEGQWIAEQQAAYEAALIDVQNKSAAHTSRTLQRQQ